MSKVEDKRAQFWNWFRHNADRLRRGFSEANSQEALTPLMDEVFDALQRYDQRLYPLIGSDPNGLHEFIISAEGHADAFSSVFELIKSAPEIDGWQLIPLKPRFGEFNLVKTTEHDGHVLSLDDTRFALAKNGDQVDLAIIVVDHEATDADAYRFMAIQMVESLLGEYDLATRIAQIDVIPLSEFQDTAGHIGRPLSEILDAIPPSQPH